MTLKRRLLLFALLFIVPIATLWILQKKLIIVNGQTMGTIYTIKCYVPSWVNKQNVSRKVDRVLGRMTDTFSTWDADSELSRLNSTKTKNPLQLSSDLHEVLHVAYKLYESSSGYYDPTLKPVLDLWGFNQKNAYFYEPKPEELTQLKTQVGLNKLIVKDHTIIKKNADTTLDLSSIAKGYAVDKVSEILESIGSKRYMIEIGGEIKVKSSNKKQQWKIGITNPVFSRKYQDLFATLSVQNAAIATSGDYQNYFQKDGKQYSHIIDPKSLKPIQSNVASVTIIAPTCLWADGLATAVMALGVKRGLGMIESLPDVEGLILVRDTNTIHAYPSSKFKDQVINPTF